jgi:hypothetical protein
VNRFVLGLGITVEVLASVLTVLSGPFDVYPVRIRTFLIEHALLWVLFLAVISITTRRIFHGAVSSKIQTVIACFIAELAATCCVWLILPSDLARIDEVNRIWFQVFANYFLRRLVTWFVVATPALIVYLIASRVGRRASSSS